jgi:hypothetical protein
VSLADTGLYDLVVTQTPAAIGSLNSMIGVVAPITTPAISLSMQPIWSRATQSSDLDLKATVSMDVTFLVVRFPSIQNASSSQPIPANSVDLEFVFTVNNASALTIDLSEFPELPPNFPHNPTPLAGKVSVLVRVSLDLIEGFSFQTNLGGFVADLNRQQILESPQSAIPIARREISLNPTNDPNLRVLEKFLARLSEVMVESVRLILQERLDTITAFVPTLPLFTPTELSITAARYVSIGYTSILVSAPIALPRLSSKTRAFVAPFTFTPPDPSKLTELVVSNQLLLTFVRLGLSRFIPSAAFVPATVHPCAITTPMPLPTIPGVSIPSAIKSLRLNFLEVGIAPRGGVGSPIAPGGIASGASPVAFINFDIAVGFGDVGSALVNVSVPLLLTVTLAGSNTLSLSALPSTPDVNIRVEINGWVKAAIAFGVGVWALPVVEFAQSELAGFMRSFLIPSLVRALPMITGLPTSSFTLPTSLTAIGVNSLQPDAPSVLLPPFGVRGFLAHDLLISLG